MSHVNIPRDLRTMSMLWVLTLAGAVLSFLTQLLLARSLGPEAYGVFASSLVTITLLSPAAGFGVAQFWMNAYGGEGKKANRWLRPSMHFVLLSSFLMVTLILAWALAGPIDDQTSLTLILMAPIVLSIVFVDLACSMHRIEERYLVQGFMQLLTPLARFVLAVLIAWKVSMLADVTIVAQGYGLIALLVLATALFGLRAMFAGGADSCGADLRGGMHVTSPPTLRRLLSNTWMYGLTAALYPVFFQVSTVQLKYARGDEEAGFFALAVAVLSAVYLLPSTIYQKFLLVKFHRWAACDKQRFVSAYCKGRRWMFVMGAVIGAVLSYVGPWGVGLAFGSAFHETGQVLTVMAACVPLRFLSTATGAVFLNPRQMKRRAAAIVVATTGIVAVNAALVPFHGVMGGAIAAVFGESLLFVFLAVMAKAELRRITTRSVHGDE